jgi:high affinity sulfate transporter 1
VTGTTGDPPSRWAPGLDRLRHYERGWLRGDLAGGLTVGALLITQCMAYAPLAGLPPSAALRGAMIGIPIYALLGSSRHLAIGPDPGTATLAAAGLATVAVAGTGEYVQAAAVLALLVGAILLAASVLRLGFLADLLSRPALVGYLAGLGISLFVSQLGKLLGVEVTSGDVVGRLRDVFDGLADLGVATAAMGLGTLALILVLKRVLPKVPASLVAVVLALAITWLFGLDRHGIAVVGEIDASLPWPSWPGLPAGDWLRLAGTAAGIALVGYADSILTGRAVADQHRDRLDANRELSGLGAANLLAGACRGMPLSSTGSGTAAMSAAGGNTSLGGIIAASFVALGLIGFPDALARIPLPALAAVVSAAAIGLVDVAAMRDLWRISRIESMVALATAAVVVSFDVLVGVLVSVALSVAIAISRMTRPHDAVLGHAAHLDGWVDVAAYPDAVTEPGLVVYRFDAPLLFTNADRYATRVLDALRDHPGVERWLVLDLEGIGSIDATAVVALRRLVDDVHREGVEVIAVARANHLTLDRLGRAGLLQPEGSLLVVPTINAAVRGFRASGGTAP